MKHKKFYDKSVYRALSFITQFGINMLVPIVILSLVGMYLDNRFGTSYWMIILFLIGAIAGGNNIYRIVRKFYDTGKNRKENLGNHVENEGEIKKD